MTTEPNAGPVALPGVQLATATTHRPPRGADPGLLEPVAPITQSVPTVAGRTPGGAASFSAFYAAERDHIARAISLTLGDAHLGAEATDEAMTRAYQRWDRVEGFDNRAGWVYRVGVNWATSFLRRKHRAPQPLHDPGPPDATRVVEPDVMAALAELDLHHRSVVVCRHVLGLSEAQTAAALNTRPGTVKSRLHRATRILQARLAHHAPDQLPPTPHEDLR